MAWHVGSVVRVAVRRCVGSVVHVAVRRCKANLKWLILAVTVSLTIMYIRKLYLQIALDNPALSKLSKGTHLNIEHRSSPDRSYRPISEVHHDRIIHLQEVCAIYSKELKPGGGGDFPKIDYCEKYKFAVCRINKAGCSVWAQILTVLNPNINTKAYRQIFKKKPNWENLIKYDTNQAVSQTIISSRDPYSRLFSAYVDKAYLTLYMPLSTNKYKCASLNRSGYIKCISDITFQQFVDCVIEINKRHGKNDGHWMPMNEICRPCEVNTSIIVKQENFSDDVEYALTRVGVEKEKYDAISEALDSKRVENTITVNINLILNEERVKNCLTWLEIASRIWKSLQIQGFLNEDVILPVDKVNAIEQASNRSKLSELILEMIKTHPLSQERGIWQRKSALVSAYQGLSNETITQIQEVYKFDFELFGYNKDPPNMD